MRVANPKAVDFSLVVTFPGGNLKLTEGKGWAIIQEALGVRVVVVPFLLGFPGGWSRMCHSVPHSHYLLKIDALNGQPFHFIT